MSLTLSHDEHSALEAAQARSQKVRHWRRALPDSAAARRRGAGRRGGYSGAAGVAADVPPAPRHASTPTQEQRELLPAAAAELSAWRRRAAHRVIAEALEARACYEAARAILHHLGERLYLA